jgi:hypothetical protein
MVVLEFEGIHITLLFGDYFKISIHIALQKGSRCM